MTWLHQSPNQLPTLMLALIVLLLTLGQYLRYLREQCGISRADLAEKVGVDYGTLGRWERDQMTPSRHHLAMLKTEFKRFEIHWSEETLRSFDELSKRSQPIAKLERIRQELMHTFTDSFNEEKF